MLDASVVVDSKNDVSNDNDCMDSNNFKRMERGIKNYMKRATILSHKNNISPVKLSVSRKMLKRQLNQYAIPISDNDSDFNWDKHVVDVVNDESNRYHPIIDHSSSYVHHNGTSDIIDPCVPVNYKVYDLSFVAQGLYLVSNALSASLQIYWAKKALEEYSTVEHTNLSNLNKVQSNRHDYSDSHNTDCIDSDVIEKQHIVGSNDCSDLWESSKNDSTPYQSFSRLRWSCLGYHYDWTMRKYRKNLKSTFPSDLARLCSNIAQLVHEDLEAEAAIVNYYPLDTCMGGHLDDAEHIMTKPIVSISIGCSALFLIGGDQKSITPTPILVRSGDAIIMSGKSRYSYHGIPAILPPTFRPLHYSPSSTDPQQLSYHNTAELDRYYHDKVYNTESCSRSVRYNVTTSTTTTVDEVKIVQIDPFGENRYREKESESMRHIVNYLQQARINMNVRQVKLLANDDSSWVDKAGSGASYI